MNIWRVGMLGSDISFHIAAIRFTSSAVAVVQNPLHLTIHSLVVTETLSPRMESMLFTISNVLGVGTL